MIQTITGCDICGWQLPRPLEVEVEGMAHAYIQHQEGEGPSHILLCPLPIRQSQIDRIQAEITAMQAEVWRETQEKRAAGEICTCQRIEDRPGAVWCSQCGLKLPESEAGDGK